MLHGAFLLALYILQALIFPHFRIFGAAPMLLPLGAMGVALFEGAARGGSFALCAGILCDVSMNQPTIMFTVVLTFIGVATGLLAETVLSRGFPSFAVLCAAALVILALFQMGRLLFFSATPRILLLKTAGIQVLYSLIFVLPLYFPVRGLGKFTST